MQALHRRRYGDHRKEKGSDYLGFRGISGIYTYKVVGVAWGLVVPIMENQMEKETDMETGPLLPKLMGTKISRAH